MHTSSKVKMAEILRFHEKDVKYSLLDVGSYDVNGSYKEIIPKNCSYLGVDLVKGPNVDVVMPGEYKLPFPDRSFDIVISGQCIEHCRNPFKLVAEMARVVKSNGWLYITAPFIWREHRYPIDTFRYLPDGMRALIEETGMKCVDAFLNEANNGFGGVDCWGIGKKELQ